MAEKPPVWQDALVPGGTVAERILLLAGWSLASVLRVRLCGKGMPVSCAPCKVTLAGCAHDLPWVPCLPSAPEPRRPLGNKIKTRFSKFFPVLLG